jgi:hypothetical protein
VPTFNTLAAALVAEGHVKVFTRRVGALASERSPDDYVELTLDASEDPPAARRTSSTAAVEPSRGTPVRSGAAPDTITDGCR